MLGTDAGFFHLRLIERNSNMNPPTVCVLALTLWLVGLAMLARPWISRRLERPRPWKATIAANSMIMSLFLWHMTAYAAAVLLLYPLGLGHEGDSTATWWLERPIWELIPALFLTDVSGVYLDGELMDSIDAARAETLVDDGVFDGGIVPKLLAAALAAKNGVAADIGVTAVAA